MKKKFLSVVVCAVAFSTLVYSNAFAAGSLKEDSFDIVAAKQELSAKYNGNYVEMTTTQKKVRNDAVDKKLTQLIAEGASEEEIQSVMESYKIYQLEVPEDYFEITPRSVGSTDVYLNKPTIYKDTVNDEWIVTGGGYWQNDSWKDDATYFNQFMSPASANLGGVDTIGVSIHNTSGSYDGVSLLSAMGYYSDGEGWSEWLQNPDNNNYESGVVFKYQDVITDPTPGSTHTDWKYRGKHFSASARYNSNFANYHGNVNTFYGHTWSGGISKLTLSNTGVSIEFSEQDKSFPIYSADTSF